jgi:Caspase domain
MLRAAFIVLWIALLPAYARADGRIALLIGNQAYNPKVGPLKNPHDDIALVGAALRSLGFTVSEVTDADYRSMDATIKRHAATVRREGQGAISLLYYSGHGAADPDTKTNYLIPIDVTDADDADLWNYSLNLNKIIEGLREQAPAATHYVVFDACRNELNLTRRGKKALTDKGFVPIAYTPGIMIAYATAPGQTAADTGSGGGPYARALADEVVKPGVEAMTMFRRVALRVKRELGQDPWMSASTLPEVYFAGEAKVDAPISAAPYPKNQPASSHKQQTNRAVITVRAMDYTRGSGVAVSSVPEWGTTTIYNAPPYTPRVNIAEYDFTATAGTYRLEVEFAAEESRPVEIYVNGVLVKADGLSDTTGGWSDVFQRWVSQGQVQLKAGRNTLKFKRESYFPHIRTFRLIPN